MCVHMVHKQRFAFPRAPGAHPHCAVRQQSHLDRLIPQRLHASTPLVAHSRDTAEDSHLLLLWLLLVMVVVLLPTPGQVVAVAAVNVEDRLVQATHLLTMTAVAAGAAVKPAV